MTDAPPQRRSPQRWILLLLAWLVGLCVWVLYLGLIAAVAYRWLS